MDSTVQIRKRGVLTLPSELREKYMIQEGDTYRLVDMDGIFVLTPLFPMVPQLANEIEQLRKSANIPLDELLQGIREERERYHKEKYESS